MRTDSAEPTRKGANFYTFRFTLFGSIFSLIFALTATVIVITEPVSSLRVSLVTQALKEEPLLWIIYVGAVLFAVSSWLAGRRVDRLRLQDLEQGEKAERLEGSLLERKQELDRAVEISRGFTRLTDLDKMLDQAVRLIQEGYALESVQVYLADLRGFNLILRSSSQGATVASVPEAKRLPQSHGTVAGTAAAERKIVATTAFTDGLQIAPDLDSLDSWRRLAIPLIRGDDLIGVLNLNNGENESLGQESVPALETIALQLAIAIDYCRIRESTEQASMEFEERARLLVQTGWQNYLNAIDRREEIGFTYRSTDGGPIDASEAAGDGGDTLTAPIIVSGEPIGSIQIQGGDGRRWSRDEINLIEEVARQVAQRVENLRLLFGAEHFRAEAEKAARLMTREGWLAYLQSTDDQVQGYKYTKGKVEELTNVADSGGVERSLVRRSLSIHGENIGHLELDLGADLDEESAELVSAVAEQLSAHLEHLRLTDQKNLALEKTEDQANRLALLNELSQALASASDEDEVLRIAAEKTGLIVPADHINIALTNESGESLQILILNGLQGLTEVGDLIPTKDSALGIATQENRVLIVNESTAAFSGASISGGGILLDKLADYFLGDGSTIESFVVAPMRSGRGVLGALSVGRKESATFSNLDAGLLLQAASLIGGTIESRRLLAETERKARDLALINRVARAVSQQLEFDKLLETFYEQISAAMAPDAFLIGLFDPETRLMDYPLMVESGNRNRQFGVRLHPESNSYKVMKSGKPILSNSSADQQRVLKSEQQGGLGGEPTKIIPASLLYVPLRVGHRTNGVLSIQSYQHNKYQPSDVALLESIANYVAIAIDNARLFEHVRSRVRREQILRNVTDRVRRTEDVNEVLKTAATEIGRVLGRKTHVYLDNSEEDASLDTPEDGQDG